MTLGVVTLGYYGWTLHLIYGLYDPVSFYKCTLIYHDDNLLQMNTVILC